MRLNSGAESAPPTRGSVAPPTRGSVVPPTRGSGSRVAARTEPPVVWVTALIPRPLPVDATDGALAGASGWRGATAAWSSAGAGPGLMMIDRAPSTGSVMLVGLTGVCVRPTSGSATLSRPALVTTVAPAGA